MSYAWDVVCYAWDADYHCTDCTIERFGKKALDDETAEDSDGNPPHPLFNSDEWAIPGEGDQILACGTCGTEIDTYEDEDSSDAQDEDDEDEIDEDLDPDGDVT